MDHCGRIISDVRMLSNKLECYYGTRDCLESTVLTLSILSLTEYGNFIRVSTRPGEYNFFLKLKVQFRVKVIKK